MATYTHREVVTRRVEYAVPTGDAMAEFDKAYAAALADWRRRNGKTDQDRLYDDWARVEARDDEVVIAFDISEHPDGADATVKRVQEAYADLLVRLHTSRGHGRDGHLNGDDLADLLGRALDGDAR